MSSNEEEVTLKLVRFFLLMRFEKCPVPFEEWKVYVGQEVKAGLHCKAVGYYFIRCQGLRNALEYQGWLWNIIFNL